MTGHVSPVFEQALRAKILEGGFNDKENQLYDILGVLEMKVAGELNAIEAVQQLAMCTTICGDLLDESHFTHAIKEKQQTYQTQLDNAGFVRQKKVILMGGQSSTSAILAPPLPTVQDGILKRVSCPKCSKWFGSTQGLGSHMRKKHDDDTISSPGSLTRFLTDHRSKPEQPATTTVTPEGDATLGITSNSEQLSEESEQPATTTVTPEEDATLCITSESEQRAEGLEQPATTTITPEGDATLRIASDEAHTLLKKRVRISRSFAFKQSVVECYIQCLNNKTLTNPAAIVADLYNVHYTLVTRWYSNRNKIKTQSKSKKTRNATRVDAGGQHNTPYKDCDLKLYNEFKDKRNAGNRIGPKWLKMRMRQLLAEYDSARLERFKGNGPWLHRWSRRHNVRVRKSTNRKSTCLTDRMPAIDQW